MTDTDNLRSDLLTLKLLIAVVLACILVTCVESWTKHPTAFEREYDESPPTLLGG